MPNVTIMGIITIIKLWYIETQLPRLNVAKKVADEMAGGKCTAAAASSVAIENAQTLILQICRQNSSALKPQKKVHFDLKYLNSA